MERLTFELKPIPKPVGGLVAFAAAIVALIFAFVFGSKLGGEMLGDEQIGIAIGVAVLCVLGPMWWFKWNRGHTPPPVTIEEGAMSGPRVSSSKVAESVPIAGLTEVALREVGKRRILVVGADDTLFAWNAQDFVEADAIDRIQAALNERIDSLPTGAAQRAAIAEQGARATRLFSRRYPASQVIIGVIAVVFGIQLATGALDSPEMLLRLGAGSPALVIEGQWWRLFSVHALHGSFLHVWMNGMGLVSLGPLVEQMIGTRRFLVVALLGGLCGFVASTAFGTYAIAVGASAVAFALMGALLVVQALHRERLPAGVAISRTRWGVMLGLNLAISLIPGVDLIAHAGGFAGGALLTYLVARRSDALENQNSMASSIAAQLTALAFICGLLATAHHALRHDVDFTAESMRAHFEAPRVGAEVINGEAWRIAIDRKAKLEHLALALSGSERAVARASSDEEKGAFLDTQAHLAHRLGRAQEAVRLQREAAALIPRADTFTTLGRYLAETPVHDEGVRVTAENAIVKLARDADEKRAVVYVRLRSEAWTDPALLRVILPAGTREAEVEVPTVVEPEVLFAGADGPEPDVTAVTSTFFAADRESLAQP